MTIRYELLQVALFATLATIDFWSVATVARALTAF